MVRENFIFLFFLLIIQMVIRSYIVAVGKEIVDLCLNSVRDLADNYTCLQGVIGL